MDLVCADFDDGSDKCKKLLNENVDKSVKSSRKVKSRARSILPSFIKIFTNL